MRDWNWTPRAYKIKTCIEATLFLIGLFAFMYALNWLEINLP